MICPPGVAGPYLISTLAFTDSPLESTPYLHYMDRSKKMDLTTARHRIAAFREDMRALAAGERSTLVREDYHIDFSGLGTVAQQDALNGMYDRMQESAMRLMDMLPIGYTSEVKMALENFDLLAENLLLKLELSDLWQLAADEEQTTDNHAFTQANYHELAKSLEALNHRYREQAASQKSLEQIVNERTNALQQANAELESINKELTSFAYISSHDLQEPLRKIQTFGSLLMANEYANLSESGKKNITKMQLAATRMNKLIKDLLAYSRTNASEKTFERTDLNALLADIELEFADTLEDKNATLIIGNMPVINGIPFQLRQLFNNLISNALKFSKEGEPPVIMIASDVVKGSSIDSPRAQQSQDYIHISVKDNGIGFSPEHASRIFEVFQRLHSKHEYEGTGIGLAICMKIADNHHAILNATSIPSEGATFNIYFPK